MIRTNDDVRDSRRTYWPRYGPAVPPPDINDDRLCTNCGYNLRGLAYATRCPECGSVGGASPGEEPLYFDEQAGVGSYFATIYQVLFDAEDFGSHVWHAGHLDWRAARRFRQLNTFIAAACFGAVMLYLMFRFTPRMEVVMLAWAVSMIGVLLWFKSVTLDRLRFLERENLLPRDPQRTKALISYLSAPLALSPLHVVALYGAVQFVGRNEWGLAITLHAIILTIQMLLVASADAHLLWQLLDVSKGQARFMGFCGAIWHAITGGFYCIALPATFTMLAKNLLGG
jgi:hypothetical protein